MSKYIFEQFFGNPIQPPYTAYVKIKDEPEPCNPNITLENYESKLRSANFSITIDFYDTNSLKETSYKSATYFPFYHSIKSGGKRSTKKSRRTLHKKRILTKRHIQKRSFKRKLRKTRR